MLSEITFETLREWHAYYELEPFGEFRGDIRSAIVARTIAAIHSRRGQEPKLKDFLPFRDPDTREKQSWEEIKREATRQARLSASTRGTRSRGRKVGGKTTR